MAQRLSRAAGQTAFGTDAAGYHEGRLGYPDDLFGAIFSRVHDFPHVMEIGAGTGLATKALLDRALAALVVVEPDPALIDFMRSRFDDPRLNFVNGSFPDVVIDGDFDLVACAAAFHWMEPKRALARIHGLLKPGGIWAMWWNAYRNPHHGDPLAVAITKLLSDIPLPPSEGRNGHYSLDTARQSAALAGAGFVDITHHAYRRERTLSTEAVLKLYGSYSYVRALPELKRERLLANIAAIVDQEFGGQAPNVVLTTLYSARANKRH